MNEEKDTDTFTHTQIVSMTEIEGNQENERDKRDNSNSEDLYKTDHVTKDGNDGDGMEGDPNDTDTGSEEDEMYEALSLCSQYIIFSSFNHNTQTFFPNKRCS